MKEIHQEKRFILGKLAQLTIAFPNFLVNEIIEIDRSKILTLPMYDPAILGVIHHGGEIVPLVSLGQMLAINTNFSTTQLTTIRLSKHATNMQGLGLVIDSILGSKTDGEISSLGIKIFQLAMLDNFNFNSQHSFTNY